jgi:hypothetical protein
VGWDGVKSRTQQESCAEDLRILPDKRRGVLHLDSRQALSKALPGVGAGSWERQKIFVVGDDVSCAAGDGKLDEHGVVRIASEIKVHPDRVDVDADKEKPVQQVGDVGFRLRDVAGQFRIGQDLGILGPHRLAQKRYYFSLLAECQQPA